MLELPMLMASLMLINTLFNMKDLRTSLPSVMPLLETLLELKLQLLHKTQLSRTTS